MPEFRPGVFPDAGLSLIFIKVPVTGSTHDGVDIYIYGVKSLELNKDV